MAEIISSDKECTVEKALEGYEVEVLSYADGMTFNRGELPTSALYIPLVCAGLKPGASIVSTQFCRQDISEMLLDIGLSHKIYMMNRDEFGIYPKFHISPDESLLEKITVMEGNKEMGRFLGVPEEDNWWQSEEDTPEVGEVMPIPEYLGLEKSDCPDNKYAKLISWVCRPTLDGLNRSIEIGKEWYEFAKVLEKKHNYSLAREAADFRMHEDRSTHYDFDPYGN